jgi:hypothetical protein
VVSSNVARRTKGIVVAKRACFVDRLLNRDTTVTACSFASSACAPPLLRTIPSIPPGQFPRLQCFVLYSISTLQDPHGLTFALPKVRCTLPRCGSRAATAGGLWPIRVVSARYLGEGLGSVLLPTPPARLLPAHCSRTTRKTRLWP